MDLEIVVEGVSDERVVSAIKRKIQQVCKDTRRSGAWSIIVSPSEMRGRWDLGVRGPFGRHFASFSDPEHIEQLPELVAQRFRTFS